MEVLLSILFIISIASIVIGGCLLMDVYETSQLITGLILLVGGIIMLISALCIIHPTSSTIKIRQSDDQISVYRKVNKDSIDIHDGILTFEGVDGETKSTVDVKDKNVTVVDDK